MPPKCNPSGRLPWKRRSETIFARLSSKPAGLLPARMGPPRVWESRGLRFTSACKSWASHVPTRIPFRHSRAGGRLLDIVFSGLAYLTSIALVVGFYSPSLTSTPTLTAALVWPFRWQSKHATPKTWMLAAVIRRLVELLLRGWGERQQPQAFQLFGIQDAVE